ncbi:MAG: aminopeptidase P family protein [Alphaproteobacteria bacterium]|nr:MAG: aminopeptidase P family protein [Alphaproteobacteria bacterium]
MFQSYDIKSDKTFGQRHLPKLRAALKELGLDAFLVPHADEYQNEYLPACGERLMWLTGFSGSAGAAIVMADKAAIFVDGRYTVQAGEQVDLELFEQRSLVTEPPHEWLQENISKGMKVGYDAWLYTVDQVELFRKACTAKGAELVAVSPNPIDTAWEDRPAAPVTPMVPHDISYAGEPSDKKRLTIGEKLSERGSDAVVITQPMSIAWLFNVRGQDVSHSPLSLAWGILKNDGTADLFVNPDKISEGLVQHLGNAVTLKTEGEFAPSLKALGEAGLTVEMDAGIAPSWVFDQLKAAGATIKRAQDPCVLPRALKNETERQGARDAHIRDGVAITKYLCWLESEAPKGELTEISAAQRLEEFRKESAELKDISFTTISAAGPHAALPHYSVDVESNRPLKLNEIYLVDSGGQYLDGTTDITRTIIVGIPSEEMKDRFTRVLKGHIQLSMARFPAGTSGAQLDLLARAALWNGGYDFDHGTGHGVGSYLGVHEGPQSISGHPKAAQVPLREGMLVSNEPGYYKVGHYGIRIENLILVTPLEDVPGGDRPMHGFETVTLAPIDRNLIDAAMLSPEEKAWLNGYHMQVRETLSPLLDETTKEWLAKATAEV